MYCTVATVQYSLYTSLLHSVGTRDVVSIQMTLEETPPTQDMNYNLVYLVWGGDIAILFLKLGVWGCVVRFARKWGGTHLAGEGRRFGTLPPSGCFWHLPLLEGNHEGDLSEQAV